MFPMQPSSDNDSSNAISDSSNDEESNPNIPATSSVRPQITVPGVTFFQAELDLELAPEQPPVFPERRLQVGPFKVRGPSSYLDPVAVNLLLRLDGYEPDIFQSSPKGIEIEKLPPLKDEAKEIEVLPPVETIKQQI